MKVHFWGVRGSIPTPLTPLQIQNRVAAVVQRITATDIRDADSRERFLASLPKWLFGTVGGNTSCVELETSQGETIILDAGSGLGNCHSTSMNVLLHQKEKRFTCFFPIFIGIICRACFFTQAFNPANRIVCLQRESRCTKHSLPSDGKSFFSGSV